MTEDPQVVQSGWARQHFRDLLDDVQHGAHAEVRRYNKPVAALVPHDWYEKAREALKNHP